MIGEMAKELIKGKRGVRWLFVLTAGVLAVASIAWACGSHSGNPESTPDLRVTPVNPTDGGRVEHLAAIPPGVPTEVKAGGGYLHDGVNYNWEAGNLQTSTHYSVRLAKKTAGGSTVCGAAWSSNEWGILTGTSTQTTGPLGQHWALTGQWPVPPALSSLSGSYDICVTPTEGTASKKMLRVDVTIL